MRSWRAAHLGIDRAREERLARARRAVEEHAARRRHTQPVEDLRVLERQVDELVHLVRVRVRVSYGYTCYGHTDYGHADYGRLATATLATATLTVARLATATH